MSTGDRNVLTGGCQCGDLRYEIRGKPVDLYICHCRECQKQSSSAFGISVIVRSEDLYLVAGKPRIWTRPATIRGSMDCTFCPRCGARVWHGNPTRDVTVSVKGGSLDTPPDMTGLRHIWVSRRLAGLLIPEDCECHAEGPPRQ